MLPALSARNFHEKVPGQLIGGGAVDLRQGGRFDGRGRHGYVRGGTYNGAVTFTRSGSAGSWITFRADQGELPIIQGSGFIGIAVRSVSSSGFGNGRGDDRGTSSGNLQFINSIADINGINGATRARRRTSGVPRAPTPSKGVDGTVREVRV